MVNKKIIRRKILVLGSFAVGKTSLVNQYTTRKFSEKYLSTIGVNIKNKTLEYNDKILNLLIWDIADIVTHQNIPPSYMQGTHGIMLVYDLSRQETFDRIQNEYEGFLHTAPNLPKIIVGNKSDLVDNVVPVVHSENKFETHFYTSAKTAENVDVAFNTLAEKFIEQLTE